MGWVDVRTERRKVIPFWQCTLRSLWSKRNTKYWWNNVSADKYSIKQVQSKANSLMQFLTNITNTGLCAATGGTHVARCTFEFGVNMSVKVGLSYIPGSPRVSY